MIVRSVILLFLITLVSSCQYFEEEPQKDVVARVKSNYLTKADIENIVPLGTSAEDSTVIVRNFIERWARRMILIDRAQVNLPEQELQRYENLVSQYRSDLLTDAYINVVVSKHLDSVISDEEYQSYYEENKENFRLNDVLLKMRYIHLSPEYEGANSIKKHFADFEEEDKLYLMSQSYGFNSSNLNDSVWVKQDNLFTLLPILKENTSVIKKETFTELKDSLGIYFIKVEDVRNIQDIAPLHFIKPTLKQIIINKRKLDLINKFEVDLTRDAIKNNVFEIYDYE